MGTTALHGYPYPEGQAQPQVHLDLKALADGVDLDTAVSCTSTTRPAHRAGRRIFETDTKASYVSDGTNWLSVVDDSGWVNLTLGAGWTATGGHTPQARRVGKVVHVRGAVTRGAGASSTLATIPTGLRPASQQFHGAHVTSGGVVFELLAGTDGTLQLITGYATGSTADGTVHPLGGAFLVA